MNDSASALKPILITLRSLRTSQTERYLFSSRATASITKAPRISAASTLPSIPSVTSGIKSKILKRTNYINATAAASTHPAICIADLTVGLMPGKVKNIFDVVRSKPDKYDTH